MNKRPDFKSFKEEVLKNAKVRAEYETLRPEFELNLAKVANVLGYSLKLSLQPKNIRNILPK